MELLNNTFEVRATSPKFEFSASDIKIEQFSATSEDRLFELTDLESPQFEFQLSCIKIKSELLSEIVFNKTSSMVVRYIPNRFGGYTVEIEG